MPGTLQEPRSGEKTAGTRPGHLRQGQVQVGVSSRSSQQRDGDKLLPEVRLRHQGNQGAVLQEDRAHRRVRA